MNNGDNSEILQEISELKENYFALIKTIQENNTNKTTNNIADELGFIDDVEINNNDNISKMVDELLANVNRISFKLQENNSSIEKLNEGIMEVFADIKAKMFDKGIRIEDMDLLIAATAIYNELTLVTNNTKHFENVPNLKIENWKK